jgi:hypothetical protein
VTVWGLLTPTGACGLTSTRIAAHSAERTPPAAKTAAEARGDWDSPDCGRWLAHHAISPHMHESDHGRLRKCASIR